jgi:hypothetical protein
MSCTAGGIRLPATTGEGTRLINTSANGSAVATILNRFITDVDLRRDGAMLYARAVKESWMVDNCAKPVGFEKS